jgi:hypothetical protein
MDDVARRHRNKNRKIPVADVSKIRLRREQGETLSALGREYGVSPQAIRAIVMRETYKYC